MKVIALEEAFSMEGLKMVPKPDDWPIPIDPQIMETWGTRLRDFEEWRLPDMDAHGVTVQVLSLTAPGIQAVPDAPTAIANAKIANDYLATVVSRHPDRFRGFAALPLQDPEAAAQELNRCVKELGFCGALVNDHTLGHYLDEPQFEYCLASACRRAGSALHSSRRSAAGSMECSRRIPGTDGSVLGLASAGRWTCHAAYSRWCVRPLPNCQSDPRAYGGIFTLSDLEI